VWEALKRRLWAFFFLCLLAFASSEYLFVVRRSVLDSLIVDFLTASVVISSVGMSIVFVHFSVFNLIVYYRAFALTGVRTAIASRSSRAPADLRVVVRFSTESPLTS
jgi:hypothetical protein